MIRGAILYGWPGYIIGPAVVAKEKRRFSHPISGTGRLPPLLHSHGHLRNSTPVRLPAGWTHDRLTGINANIGGFGIAMLLVYRQEFSFSRLSQKYTFEGVEQAKSNR
jgi:hypothetical protein